MGTTRAGGQILGSNGAYLFQLRRIPPNIEEGLSSKISAGQGELYAGKNISIRSDVAAGMAGAARITLHYVVVRGRRWCAEFLHVTDESRVQKGLLYIGRRGSQGENRSVTIHFRSDRRVQRV
jgi:hypothetical protein